MKGFSTEAIDWVPQGVKLDNYPVEDWGDEEYEGQEHGEFWALVAGRGLTLISCEEVDPSEAGFATLEMSRYRAVCQWWVHLSHGIFRGGGIYRSMIQDTLFGPSTPPPMVRSSPQCQNL